MKQKKTKNKTMWLSVLAVLLILETRSQALATDILVELGGQAQKEKIDVLPFNSERGEKIFRSEHVGRSGDKVSCTSCHTANPMNRGRTKANKEIEPLAPAANSKRFTDSVKVEKWFRRNCMDVLQRECSLQEKGDFVKFMFSVK